VKREEIVLTPALDDDDDAAAAADDDDIRNERYEKESTSHIVSNLRS
jgi:hypothetical protein